MDASSTKTNLSSLITKAEHCYQWFGQPPCVCYYSQQGCHQHNPTQSLIFRNTCLPPKQQQPNFFSRILSSFWNDSWQTASSKETPKTRCEPLLVDVVSSKEPEPLPLFSTELPFDSQSVDTLQPLHPTMPYHLAFYHLDCIRRQLDPGIKVAFIPELSCGGISRFYENSPEYTWSSEIYFDNGTFLQKQELSCVIDRGSDCRTLKFTACHHITFEIMALWFKYNDTFITAHSLLSFPRIDDEEIFGYKWWTSKMGRFTRMSVCGKCHSDTESTLELVGHQLHIRYTCYRDLGPATDRSIPKWRCLLTGEGVTNRFRTFDLYARVWQTAQQLGRPNLHMVTHATSSGEFVVGTL